MSNRSFEQGPIRPPSEAQSLLLRFTRNCSWNKCLFCPVYKGREFSRRSVEEVKADIDTVAGIIREVRGVAGAEGPGGQLDAELAQSFFRRDYSSSYLNVVAWLYYGRGSVFLQDANNLILKTDHLTAMLEYLFEKVDGITRVTSYSRSNTASRKTVEELKRIRRAGLDRIHVGLETGYDPLLKLMKKGVTAAAQIDGGRKIKEAGMELSMYYMPGLGGKAMWREHAIESARVLNAVNPDFIRLRTLRVPERIELHGMVLDGTFEQLSDDEAVEEIRLFIENLDGIESFVASDHIMNLLQDVEGYLPRDKAHMLETIDRYLNLSPDERLHYRLGRRMGHYLGVADMWRPELAARVDAVLRRLKAEAPENIEAIMNDLANRTV